MDKDEEAREVLELAFTSAHQELGKKNLLTAELALNLGSAFLKMNNPVKALQHLQMAHDVYIEADPNSLRHFAAKTKIGNAYLLLKDYEQAKTWLNDGHKGLSQLNNVPNEVLVDSIRQLSILAKETGDNKSERRWSQKLEQLKQHKESTD